MPQEIMQNKENQILRKPEFLLVFIMLIALTILVIAVLWIPFGDIPNGYTTNMTVSYTDLLDYRKNILAVILTAFGAWIGAGAAYFFGHENLREATNSLLQMREPSPKERLHRTFVRDISLKPIDWIVKCDDKLNDIVDKLKKEPERWFIPIVKNNGSLKDVIKDEAIWRFVDNESEKKAHYDKIMQESISEVLKFIKSKPELSRVFENVYVPTTLDKSAGEIYDLMQNKGIYLAVVTDEKGKPTQYFDTGDVRRLLLKFS